MRYRKLDAQGDYSVDPGAVWLVDTPETVAQAVRTRLKLFAGEWFLDTNEGLHLDRITGVRTQGSRDLEIQQRILQTKGVRSIISYASRVNSQRRTFRVGAVIDTIYGAAAIGVTMGGGLVPPTTYPLTIGGLQATTVAGEGYTVELPPLPL